MRWLGKLVWAIAALVGLATIAAGASMMLAGIGTRTPPGNLETRVARTARHALIPAAARNRPNPAAATPDIVREGMEHWADHCATCHGNDGGGDTEIGRSLYPRAPDMRTPVTQDLSDGELFYIIENGVKLTGMPAWGNGTSEGEESSWHLVHFIRHLPKLSDAEIAEMESLNPRGPDAWRAQEEEQRFLAGDNASPSAPAPPAHKH
jgi:mono/diheme cytochrome c family protein